jgi:excisionase family DNA binding protein
MNTVTRNDGYLSVEHAAAYLDLTVCALRERMKRGSIPAWTWTRLGGTSIRFIKSALDEWLQPVERAEAFREVHVKQSSQSRRLAPLKEVERRA